MFKTTLKFWSVALTMLVLGSCSKSDSTSEGPPQPEPEKRLEVKLDAEFRLPIHEKAWIEAQRLNIEFSDVTEDSRCPIGDRCIWAGQASILVRLTQEDETLGEAKLTSRVGEPDSTDVKVGGFSVRLISIEPYPESGSEIQKSDYVATLMVSQGL